MSALRFMSGQDRARRRSWASDACLGWRRCPSLPRLRPTVPKFPPSALALPGLGYVRAEHVAAALKAGYRHIDTARKYGTEPAVGEGIRASGIPRSRDLRLHESFARKPACRRFRSLGRRKPRRRSAWITSTFCSCIGRRKTRRLRKPWARSPKRSGQGLTRHVGVANFNIAMLDDGDPRFARSRW